MALVDLLTARAAAAPDRVALAVEGRDLTFGEWERRSAAVARGLAARGVAGGDRVALLFSPGGWEAFAVAHLGVLRAGAAAVLVSAGASAGSLSRALADSGAAGVLSDADAALPEGRAWVAAPAAVEADPGEDVVPPAAEPPVLLYPPAWLARPRPVPLEDCAAPLPDAPGPTVHAWAPGSLAGERVLASVLAGAGAPAASLAAFEPDRLCALVAGAQAPTLGLTPALAAALVASGAPARHDLAPVRHVVLSAPPSDGLGGALAQAFPAACVTALDAVAGTTDAGAPPVAVSQEAMVWHELLSPGSFNLPCLVRRYRGRLDVGAMAWALSEIVRRHEPLRSTFAVVDGEARQVIGAATASDLAVVDLAALPEAERDAEAARLLGDATSRPFDLATGPLFEPRLLRLGPEDHVLAVRLHHTVFDDWSVDVFRRELSALYAAGLARAPSPLAEPPVAFSRFSRNQRTLLHGEAGAAQRAWWRRELEGAPLAVQLPVGGSGGGRTSPLQVDLPAPLAAELRALAARLRATPYMTVLAAFSVLVSRATGLDDLVIASVVAHRNRTPLESLIGCFTKKVPLRLRLEGDPTFAELVHRARAALLGALSHQDLAFEAALQEGLGEAAAEHGVAPQIAVVFQAETPRRSRLVLPGLVAGPYEPVREARSERHFSAGIARWGDGIYGGGFLILSLVEAGEGMALVARGSFDPPAVARLLEALEALLEDVARAPDRPVAELRGAGARTSLEDAIALRGFRAGRSRLEAALARAPGVREVALAVSDGRLVAYVVAGGGTPPTLAGLRRALWAGCPGTVWPAAAVAVPSLPRLPDGAVDVAALPPPDGLADGTDPWAELLAAMWSEVRGRPANAHESYWQDFSFLDVVAEARQAGLAITDEDVARCRTPEMLAAAAGLQGPR